MDTYKMKMCQDTTNNNTNLVDVIPPHYNHLPSPPQSPDANQHSNSIGEFLNLENFI